MDYKDELRIELSKKADEEVSLLPSFAKKFFSHLKSKGMSERTRLQYAYDMKRFFNWLSSSAGFCEIDFRSATASEVLDKLTVEDLQEYEATIEYCETSAGEAKLSSGASKARKLCSLRSFLKYYHRIGDTENSLSDLIDIPKIPEHSISVMSTEQVSRILAAVSSTEGMDEGNIKRHSKIVKRDFAIMMLFLGTGIRVSELCGLDTKDIDFVEDSIRITRKGGDEDVAYFGLEVEDALKDYLDGGRAALLGSEAGSDALFISMQHRRMTPRSVELMIKGYAAKAGLNIKATPHLCRRTYGTSLYEETGDIYLVAEALHHSSVETTKKHYAKMGEERKKLAAEASRSLFK